MEDGYSLRFNNKQLDLPDKFFWTTRNNWLSEEPRFKFPLSSLNFSSSDLSVPLVNQSLPVFFGEPGILKEPQKIICNTDIIGTAFYFLSRYEEMVVSSRDKYERFLATSSLSYRAGVLDRPVVDEYIEVLWACMKQLWPSMERKTRQGEVQVSCDVDNPYDCKAKSVTRLAYALVGDVLKRRSVAAVRGHFKNYVSTQKGEYQNDPYNTFEWYMDTCERFDRQAAFYFIAEHSSREMDGCYDLSELRILDLLQQIGKRGHEIGMHGSFNSFRDGNQIFRERERLMKICDNLDIDASVRGNRQHFLRWDASQTPDHLEASGFEYDATGSFTDMPGFRYGTSRPFRMWSWKTEEPLMLKQRPLTMMEASVIGDRYMGLGHSDKALSLMMSLKQKALAHGGDFTLLWHNSHLTTEADKAFFTELIK